MDKRISHLVSFFFKKFELEYLSHKFKLRHTFSTLNHLWHVTGTHDYNRFNDATKVLLNVA